MDKIIRKRLAYLILGFAGFAICVIINYYHGSGEHELGEALVKVLVYTMGATVVLAAIAAVLWAINQILPGND